MNCAIIVAAGKSKRMDNKGDKIFFTLGSRPVIAYSLDAFQKCEEINSVILVVRAEKLEAARNMVQLYSFSKVERIVPGGVRRQDSVFNGLKVISEETEIIVVHDGARPLVTPQLITQTINSAKKYGSGVAAIKITDTIKEAKPNRKVIKTVDRTRLWAVQTPQAFKKEILLKAFEILQKKRKTVTDESSAVEMIGVKVTLVPSSWTNIKITSPEDLLIANALLRL